MSTLNVVQREDGIFVIGVPDLSHQTVEAWSQIKQELYQAAQHSDDPLRLLYDIRKAGHPMPDSAKHILQHSGQWSAEAPPRSIAILTAPFALGLVERAVSRLPSYSRDNVKAFLTEAEAVRWLNGRLEHAL